MVYIGIPYGTSMWQVADSKQQDGSFKISIRKAKQKLLSKRLDTYMDSPDIYPTDIMSIVNEAWDNSFAIIESNKRAISEQGWSSLNYALLNDDHIRSTMSDLENRQYHMMLKSNHDGSIPSIDGITTSTSQQSLPVLTQSSISELTNTDDCANPTKKIEMNYDPKYLTIKVLLNSVCTVIMT